MKILFIADGRSPIALNWIRYFVESGHEVHLASIFPCQPALDFASVMIIPVAFSGVVERRGAARGARRRVNAHKGLLRKIATPKVRTWLRHRFVPRSLPQAVAQLQALINRLQPDLIHAMRIPYEGMLASLALRDMDGPPLLVSVWGNDFTLHAPATSTLRRLTRLTIEQADALHTDCRHDRHLAREWGFDQRKPAVVLPGAGGIQTDVFMPLATSQAPDDFPITIINPRGLRAYVRNDTFFRAVPRVLRYHPQGQFLCPSMKGQPEAESWVSRLGVKEALQLLPRLTRSQMVHVYQQSQIVLSITEHDGTPNTLLEALACGCFPIAGDIPSLREWITHGKNGFLVNPSDPEDLAKAILIALSDPELRAQARNYNSNLIAECADYSTMMKKADDFYQRLS